MIELIKEKRKFVGWVQQRGTQQIQSNAEPNTTQALGYTSFHPTYDYSDYFTAVLTDDFPQNSWM
jgi:hypothetical protein